MLPALCGHYSASSLEVVLHARYVELKSGCYFTIIGKRRGNRGGWGWDHIPTTKSTAAMAGLI